MPFCCFVTRRLKWFYWQWLQLSMQLFILAVSTDIFLSFGLGSLYQNTKIDLPNPHAIQSYFNNLPWDYVIPLLCARFWCKTSTVTFNKIDSIAKNFGKVNLNLRYHTVSSYMSHDVWKQPFGQNDLNVRNGGKISKWCHRCYETNTTV